jgi:hypothetical protein
VLTESGDGFDATFEGAAPDKYVIGLFAEREDASSLITQACIGLCEESIKVSNEQRQYTAFLSKLLLNRDLDMEELRQSRG